MSQFGVIMALIFSLLIAIFALANNQPIIVNYLYGKTEISAIIVILGAAILGALVMFLLNMLKQIKAGFRLRSLQHELNEYRSEADELRNERDALLVQLGQLQESAANPEGDIGVPESSSTEEPYVTGYYMSQPETEAEKNVGTKNEEGQNDAARSSEEIGSESVVEDVCSAEQETGMTEKDDLEKDEKGA